MSKEKVFSDTCLGIWISLENVAVVRDPS